MRRRVWFVGAAVVLLIAVLGAGVLVIHGDDGPATTDSDELGRQTPVCGFEGRLASKITADRPSDADPVTVDRWDADTSEGHVERIFAAADQILLQRQGPSGQTVLDRHGDHGGRISSTSIDLDRDPREEPHSNGSPAVAPDGTVFVLDTYQGRRELLHYGADGRRLAAFEVPSSDETTGHPLDLQDVTWVPDLDDSPAVLVGEGQRTVHAFRPDGEYLGVLDEISGAVVGVVGQSVVVTLSTSGRTTLLEGTDLSTGQTVLHVPYSDADEESGRGTPPGLLRLHGIVPGPDEDGFLIASADGIAWVDGHGVRRGIWMNDTFDMTLWESGDIVERAGQYWILTRDGEGEHVITVDSERMRALLEAPVSPKASNEATLAQLGVGVGPVTDVSFNHFDPGRTPEVYLETAPGWGLLNGVPATLTVHYRVSGDPLLADPVAQSERTVAVPVDGGRVPLHLPQSRPGAYEISLWMTQENSDVPMSGSCLRYSISPADAPLELDALSDGAGWGGPEPLRGVELAQTLGIGSHRVQLDFGALVPRPAASPAAAGVQWSALPGAGDRASPRQAFAELRAAAELARNEHIDLIVQVGQNGDAERAAVDAGTWGGWSQVIVEAFATYAPEVTYWSAWNEPNLTFDDGAVYTERVEVPFAAAVHHAGTAGTVLAGNTLGFATDWWQQAASAGICDAADAVAVHPYTGWNRSWEEEGFAVDGSGFDALRAALGDGCAGVPLWDTESGWTSDGPAASWAQGQDIARKLLWYADEQVAGWTYFFSEGGWGENDLSWSLIQYESYVKPGALAFATVSRMLVDRARPTDVAMPIPYSYGMRLDGTDEDVVAVWTDSLRIGVSVRTDAQTLTVVDQYGGRSTPSPADGQVEITLTGSPQFLVLPRGATVELDALEPFGRDVLRGAEVDASSTHEDLDPQTITSGTPNPYRPWRSGRLAGGLDEQPQVDVLLEEATTIDRIAVTSGSIICCEAGLRDYTVSVRTTAGDWVVVAEVQDQFWDRIRLLQFDPVEVTGVRIEVPWSTVRGTRMLSANYTGFVGGLPPPFMGVQTESDYVVAIAAVAAWQPGDS